MAGTGDWTHATQRPETFPLTQHHPSPVHLALTFLMKLPDNPHHVNGKAERRKHKKNTFLHGIKNINQLGDICEVINSTTAKLL